MSGEGESSDEEANKKGILWKGARRWHSDSNRRNWPEGANTQKREEVEEDQKWGVGGLQADREFGGKK